MQPCDVGINYIFRKFVAPFCGIIYLEPLPDILTKLSNFQFFTRLSTTINFNDVLFIKLIGKFTLSFFKQFLFHDAELVQDPGS